MERTIRKYFLALASAAGASVAAFAQPPPAADPPAATNTVVSAPGGVDDTGTVYPRIGGAYQTEGAGYEHSFSSIQGFVPILQVPGESVTFFDGSFLIANDQKVGFNAGAGHRFYLGDLDRTFGGYFYYDNRDTGLRNYSQLSAGIESLGSAFDFRANGYFPIDNDPKVIGDGTPIFAGRTVLLDSEVALAGYDWEIGRRLFPVGTTTDVHGYLGNYAYFSQRSDRTNVQKYGVMARLEARINDMVRLDVRYQNDGVFDSNVVLTAQIVWPPYRAREQRGTDRQVADRLGEPILRQSAIAVERRREAAIDPRTGAPLDVIHVVANAPAGGVGSLEDPFNTLSQAEGESTDGDIILVHAGTYNDGITLKPNQRLLGSGFMHQAITNAGPINLPVLEPGSRPVLRGATESRDVLGADNAAVVLAANTEVSAININLAGVAGAPFGISGNQFIGDVNINRNIIQNTGGNGVEIIAINGDLSIVGNQFLNAGVAFSSTFIAGGVGNLLFANNIIQNSGLNGIVTQDRGNNQTNADSFTFTGNSFTNIGSDGIQITRLAGIVNINNNTLTNVASNAIEVNGPFLGGITIDNNALTNSGGSMIFLGNVTVATVIASNVINGAGVNGVTATNHSGRLSLLDNVISNSTQRHASLDSLAGANTTFNVLRNTFTAGNNFRVFNDGATLCVNLDDNNSNNNLLVDRTLGGTLLFFDGGQIAGAVVPSGGAVQVFVPCP